MAPIANAVPTANAALAAVMPLEEMPEPTMHPLPPTAEESDALASLVGQRAEYLRFVRRRMQNDSDAEDVLQHALLTASLKLHTLHDADTLRAWFFRVLRRAVYDHRVAESRRETGVAKLAREVSGTTNKDAAVCGCSLGLLGKLGRDYAEVLQRIDIDEENIAQVAAELSLTPNNTKVRLHRARKALRVALKACCGADTLRSLNACSC